MNSLTQNVLAMQSMDKASVEYDYTFSEVYIGVDAATEKIINSFSVSLKGDLHAAQEVAAEHLMILVGKFEYQGYEFLTFYKKSLKNRLIDLVRSLNAAKVRHNTSYEVSLSMDVTDGEGSSFNIEDRFQDAALQVNDEYNIETGVSIATILEAFAAKKPVEAELVELSMMYSPENGYKKKDLANAVADYFNSDTYTNTLQQRLSRATKNFYKFAEASGYSFNF